MKKWYQSKTLWFNVLTFVVGLATALLDQKLFTNPVVVSIFTLVISVGNLALRIFFTGMPIQGTPIANRMMKR